LKKPKYALPEITALCVALATIVFMAIFLQGYFRLLIIAPTVMTGLIVYHASLIKAWKTWKEIAHYIFLPISIFLLTLGFVFGVGLTALFARLSRTKLLDMKFERKDTYWVERTADDKTLGKIQRPF